MYYSQIRVDPSNNQNIWVLGTSLYLSKDGGKTFRSDNTARGIHVDHHSMWIDPRDGNHVILGNDGGIHVTYDQGLNWDHLNHVAIGQFYHVAIGPRRDYCVYGGLQDNGSWGGPHRGQDGRGAINTDWLSIGGGDGFVCAVDPEDPFQIYSESQGGATGRIHLKTGERGSLRPRPSRNERYRFNWKTPFLLSPHNSRVFYSAGNYVFRSPYKGNDLQRISPEVTRTDQGSGSALAESPQEEGVLYVGTTDGALWVTRNGGHEWTNLYGKQTPAAKETPAKEPVAAEPVAAETVAEEPAAEEGPSDEESAQEPAPAGDPQRGARGPGPRGPGGFGPGGSGMGGPQRMAEILLQQDANGDGQLQRDEMPERMERMFDRLDSNGDGALSKDELENLSARFRRPGGERPPGPAGPGGPGRDPAPAGATEPPPLVEKDIVSGTWEGRLEGENMPADRAGITLVMRMDPQGQVRGEYQSAMGNGSLDGKFNPDNNELSMTVDTERAAIELTCTITGTELTGQMEFSRGFSPPFSARRTGDAPALPASAAAGGKPLSELLPGPRWISSIEASRFRRGRVYITCDGHRSNDDQPYLFASEDYGATWNSLVANLPHSVGSARVIREDVTNENVLYLGTEFSIWISINRGQNWTKLNSNLPTVAVHEIAVHPLAGEIVAATHGRSLWVLDVSALRQLTPATIGAAAQLYRPQEAIKWQVQPRRGSAGTRQFQGATPSSGAAIYYSLGKAAQSVSLSISDIEGTVIRQLDGGTEKGLHRVQWDLQAVAPASSGGGRQRRGRTVDAGKYLVTLTVDGQTFKEVLTVADDPALP